MRLALQEAEASAYRGEVPVGAVVVHKDKEIALAGNRVEESSDATQHAEMLALRQASSALGAWRLLDTALYCTLEPCLMCSGAIYLARVATVVFAARDVRFGAFMCLSAEHKQLQTITVRHGVLVQESSSLLRKFFKEQRAQYEQS